MMPLRHLRFGFGTFLRGLPSLTPALSWLAGRMMMALYGDGCVDVRVYPSCLPCPTMYPLASLLLARFNGAVGLPRGFSRRSLQ